MERTSLLQDLRSRLIRHTSRVLLRVVIGPSWDRPIELTGQDILRSSMKLAGEACLSGQRGLVLLLLPHSVELFLLQIGFVLQGFSPAVLPWPTTRVNPLKYQRNLLHQLRSLPADQLVTIPRLAKSLARYLPYPTVGQTVAGADQYDVFGDDAFGEFNTADGPIQIGEEVPSLPDGALFVQFSGGTTGLQKAVAVTASMLDTQLQRLATVLAFGATDTVVSWLPMYHDMGLIACLWLPLWLQASSVQMAATDWLLKPELLFRYLERYRGTFSWLPNFAFSYLAQRRAAMSQTYALDHVRAIINCSEPVRISSVNSFAAAFQDWGLRKSALQASYGMAENVFAVTQSPLDDELSTTAKASVEYGAARRGELGFSLQEEVFVSSGKPLPDTEIRICDSTGNTCQDKVAGEIQIRTPSTFDGYWSNKGMITSSITDDRFHRTGDYGFITGGELYVIGRMNDMIIVGGQNVFPEDIEAVVNAIEGIYPGRVVVFGVVDERYGTQAITVVAELRGEYKRDVAGVLEDRVREAVLVATGIPPRYTCVVPERWIVKSTAGKISRRDTRERFLSEKL